MKSLEESVRAYSLQVTDNFQPIHREDRNTVRSEHRVPGWGGWQAPRWIEQAAGGGRTRCYYSQSWLPGKLKRRAFSSKSHSAPKLCQHSQVKTDFPPWNIKGELLTNVPDTLFCTSSTIKMVSKQWLYGAKPTSLVYDTGDVWEVKVCNKAVTTVYWNWKHKTMILHAKDASVGNVYCKLMHTILQIHFHPDTPLLAENIKLRNEKCCH